MKDNGNVSSVFVRVDVRNVSETFIARVLEIARKNGWLLRTDDERVFQPSFAKLLSAIHASAAFRFVENPQRFIEALSKAQESDTDPDAS
jgi:hypothetical protein